jgi:hypothetical protein
MTVKYLKLFILKYLKKNAQNNSKLQLKSFSMASYYYGTGELFNNKILFE